MSIFDLLRAYYNNKINFVELKDLLKNHRKDDLIKFILSANRQGCFKETIEKNDFIF